LILAIDTASARSGIAVVAGGAVLAESVRQSGRDYDVAAEVAALVPDPSVLTSVLVGLGPGSFTGLRAGIAYGVGLAMALRVPLLVLGSLDLVAARALVPALAVSEAGRRRFYYLTPDGERGVAEAAQVPRSWPICGWVSSTDLEVLPDTRLRTFGEAVLYSLGGAREVGYGTVKPEYMQDFGRLD